MFPRSENSGNAARECKTNALKVTDMSQLRFDVEIWKAKIGNATGEWATKAKAGSDKKNKEQDMKGSKDIEEKCLDGCSSVL